MFNREQRKQLKAAKRQRKQRYQAERLAIAISHTEPGHRPEAYNCVQWTGDRGPVYWGTCPKCPADKQEF